MEKIKLYYDIDTQEILVEDILRLSPQIRNIKQLEGMTIDHVEVVHEEEIILTLSTRRDYFNPFNFITSFLKLSDTTPPAL